MNLSTLTSFSFNLFFFFLPWKTFCGSVTFEMSTTVYTVLKYSVPMSWLFFCKWRLHSHPLMVLWSHLLFSCLYIVKLIRVTPDIFGSPLYHKLRSHLRYMKAKLASAYNFAFFSPLGCSLVLFPEICAYISNTSCFHNKGFYQIYSSKTMESFLVISFFILFCNLGFPSYFHLLVKANLMMP